MTSKEQFIRQKELAAWWQGVASDTRFDSVLVYAAAATLESCPSAEQREGVIFFREMLLNLSLPEAPPPAFARPGLNHDLDIARRTLAVKTETHKTEPKKV